MSIQIARRPAVWICLCLIAAIAAGLYWNSLPSELELRLRGVWRSQVLGADDFQLLTFTPDGRILAYDSVKESFRDSDESWAAEGDQIRVDLLRSLTTAQRLSHWYHRLIGSSVGQRGVGYYDIQWNGRDECTLTATDPKTTLTINMFRETNPDPSIWDESGFPLREISPRNELR